MQYYLKETISLETATNEKANFTVNQWRTRALNKFLIYLRRSKYHLPKAIDIIYFYFIYSLLH